MHTNAEVTKRQIFSFLLGFSSVVTDFEAFPRRTLLHLYLSKMPVLKLPLINGVFASHFYSTVIFPVDLGASAVSYFDYIVHSTILDRKREGVSKQREGIKEEEMMGKRLSTRFWE